MRKILNWDRLVELRNSFHKHRDDFNYSTWGVNLLSGSPDKLTDNNIKCTLGRVDDDIEEDSVIAVLKHGCGTPACIGGWLIHENLKNLPNNEVIGEATVQNLIHNILEMQPIRKHDGSSSIWWEADDRGVVWLQNQIFNFLFVGHDIEMLLLPGVKNTMRGMPIDAAIDRLTAVIDLLSNFEYVLLDIADAYTRRSTLLNCLTFREYQYPVDYVKYVEYRFSSVYMNEIEDLTTAILNNDRSLKDKFGSSLIYSFSGGEHGVQFKSASTLRHLRSTGTIFADLKIDHKCLVNGIKTANKYYCKMNYSEIVKKFNYAYSRHPLAMTRVINNSIENDIFLLKLFEESAHTKDWCYHTMKEIPQLYSYALSNQAIVIPRNKIHCVEDLMSPLSWQYILSQYRDCFSEEVLQDPLRFDRLDNISNFFSQMSPSYLYNLIDDTHDWYSHVDMIATIGAEYWKLSPKKRIEVAQEFAHA